MAKREKFTKDILMRRIRDVLDKHRMPVDIQNDINDLPMELQNRLTSLQSNYQQPGQQNGQPQGQY